MNTDQCSETNFCFHMALRQFIGIQIVLPMPFNKSFFYLFYFIFAFFVLILSVKSHARAHWHKKIRFWVVHRAECDSQRRMRAQPHRVRHIHHSTHSAAETLQEKNIISGRHNFEIYCKKRKKKKKLYKMFCFHTLKKITM